MAKVDDLVSEAYQNAEENGNDMDSLTSREVAEDMKTCDADLGKFHVLDIAYAVIQYRKREYGRWRC